MSDPHLGLALRVGALSAWEWRIGTDQVTWSQAMDGLEPSSVPTIGAFLDRVHADDRERVRRAVNTAAETGEGFEIEFHVVLDDGRIRVRTAACDVVRDADGRPSRVVGVGRDVTDEREAGERLRQAEGRYRTLVEQLPLVSYVEGLDEESAMYISPQIAELAGYSAEEWVADPSFFARVLHPDDRDTVLAGFARMHQSGEPFDCEYRIISRDGRTVWIHDAAVVVFDGDGKPQYAQGYMLDVTERKRSEAALRRSQQKLEEQLEQIEYQALHDALTDLPNRTLFADRAAQAVLRSEREGSRFAVMLLDLDRFKEVNDTLGHPSGDLLLREIAGRLRRALRASDTVARLGGDEFGIVAPALDDAAAARDLADVLRRRLAEPVVLGGLTIEVEASVGIALYPDHGDDVETLTRHADVSMYVSKTTHTPIVYAAAYDHHSLARLALVSELRHAIDNDELVVHYQPQVDVATGEVRKVEALVRWAHPVHGLLQPGQFIPLAEQTGLIRALTKHVLDRTLAQCSAWRAAGRHLRVAVNITARELVDLGFPDEVTTLLAKWRVDPSQLELEVTESTIMTDQGRAVAVLAELRRRGVRLAIDDFGSGHASLGYLRKLPIDVLKIDRSFIGQMSRTPGDAAIVRAAIELGHNLGLEVVAEGVETQQERHALESLGCDTLQGFHFARPGPAAELDAVPQRLPAPSARRVAG
jgi:diguanylate cyclase (GGDEF)-like protein/PAS domain S-box-containing protein